MEQNIIERFSKVFQESTKFRYIDAAMKNILSFIYSQEENTHDDLFTWLIQQHFYLTTNGTEEDYNYRLHIKKEWSEIITKVEPRYNVLQKSILWSKEALEPQTVGGMISKTVKGCQTDSEDLAMLALILYAGYPRFVPYMKPPDLVMRMRRMPETELKEIRNELRDIIAEINAIFMSPVFSKNILKLAAVYNILDTRLNDPVKRIIAITEFANCIEERAMRIAGSLIPLEKLEKTIQKAMNVMEVCKQDCNECNMQEDDFGYKEEKSNNEKMDSKKIIH
jgi:hypothetical protein